MKPRSTWKAALAFVACFAGGPVIAQLPVPLYAAPPSPPPQPVAPVQSPTGDARAEAQTRVERLTAEVTDLGRRRDEAYARLRARARGLYRLRRSAPIPTGGFEALLARAGRLERLERVLLDDVARFRSLDRRLVELRRDRQAAEEALREASRRAEQAEAIEAAIAAQYGYGDLGLPNVGSLPIAPMPALEDVPGGVTAVAAAAPVGGFASLRGRLGIPLTTSIGLRDAVRDDGPGVEFLARPGTTVLSVAEGRVAFAGDYGSYGRMIILDHGDTFYTIYAGIGRIRARVGDYVVRGADLGDVAGGTTPALFFEVRRGTRSLDTRNWLGVER